MAKLNFLLDEDVMPRKLLARFTRRASITLRHIVHDEGKSGLKDWQVLQIARKQKRIVVTFDRKFVSDKTIAKNIAILCIVGGDILSADELQNRILRVVDIFPDPDDYFGKVIFASKEHCEVRNDSGRKMIQKYRR